MSLFMKRILALSFFLSCIPGQLTLAAEVECDGNEEILQRFMTLSDRVFNGRELEVIGDYIAEDFTVLGAPPNFPFGPDVIRSHVLRTAESFPERSVTPNLIACTSDRVIVHHTIRGVNDGPYMDNPATGESVEYNGIAIYKFRDGKVVQFIGSDDTLSLIRQLGYTIKPPMSDE